MGINASACCCCEGFYGNKEITHKTTPVFNSFEVVNQDIVSSLETARVNFWQLLKNPAENISIMENCTVSLSESYKGHILKVNFGIAKTPADFTNFLFSTPRSKWDSLIETTKVLEENSKYKIIYLKYKSQVSYSAKEIVIARKVECKDGVNLTYFTSVPDEKKNSNNRIEVFEGGYCVEGSVNSEVTMIAHFKIGGNALTKLMQKLCEKFVPEAISMIEKLMS